MEKHRFTPDLVDPLHHPFPFPKDGSRARKYLTPSTSSGKPLPYQAQSSYKGVAGSLVDYDGRLASYVEPMFKEIDIHRFHATF